MPLSKLIAAFLLSLVVSATALLPASAVLPQVAGITRPQGSFWSATARSTLPPPLTGVITWQANPGVIFGADASIRFEGPFAKATGKLSYSSARYRLSVEEATVELTGLAKAGELAGQLVLTDATIEGEGQRCTAATGVLESDAVTRLGEEYGWQAPVLSGTLGCADGRLTAQLAGEDASGKISAQWRLGGPVRMTVAGDGRLLRAALPRAGFQRQGSGWAKLIEVGG